MTEDAGFQRVGSGCGIQGCLFGAMALFAILMVAMLIIAFFRFREPPQGVQMPPVGMSAQGVVGRQPSGMVVSRQSSVTTAGRRCSTDDRRLTTGVEGRGRDHA